MRALIAEEEAYESTMDYVHSMPTTIKRLIVPEAGNLTFTIHKEELYVSVANNITDYKILGETEVPDDLVEQAKTFLQVKQELQAKVSQFLI